MVDRLHRYEERSATPLLVLALVFIAVYAAPIIHPSLPRTLRTLLGSAAALIWLLFVLDLGIRVALADRRWRYLAAHPVDVLIVLLPALRPLRIRGSSPPARPSSPGPGDSPSAAPPGRSPPPPR